MMNKCDNCAASPAWQGEFGTIKITQGYLCRSCLLSALYLMLRNIHAQLEAVKNEVIPGIHAAIEEVSEFGTKPTILSPDQELEIQYLADKNKINYSVWRTDTGKLKVMKRDEPVPESCTFHVQDFISRWVGSDGY